MLFEDFVHPWICWVWILAVGEKVGEEDRRKWMNRSEVKWIANIGGTVEKNKQNKKTIQFFILFLKQVFNWHVSSKWELSYGGKKLPMPRLNVTVRWCRHNMIDFPLLNSLISTFHSVVTMMFKYPHELNIIVDIN